MRRALTTLTIAVLASLTFAACGDDTSDPGPSGADAPAAGTDAFPVTVEHAFGETTIESKPERIATVCLLYTSPSPRDRTRSRMPSSA